MFSVLMIGAAAAAITFTPDKFSAVDDASVTLSEATTYAYQTNVKLEVLVDKATHARSYALWLVMRGARAPAEILSVRAPGGRELKPLRSGSGQLSCGRLTGMCHVTLIGIYPLTETELDDLRAGKTSEFKVLTSDGEQASWIVTISPEAFATLDDWMPPPN